MPSLSQIYSGKGKAQAVFFFQRKALEEMLAGSNCAVSARKECPSYLRVRTMGDQCGAIGWPVGGSRKIGIARCILTGGREGKSVEGEGRGGRVREVGGGTEG